MEILLVIIALALGFLAAWMLSQNNWNKKKLEIENILNESNRKLLILQTEKETITKSNEDLINRLEKEKQELKGLLANEQQKSEALNSRIAKAETEFRNLQDKLNTQKAELEDLQKKFTTEFENIANKILKQNSQEFTAVNQKNIADILNPLKEKIITFEQKVQDTHEKGIRDSVSLREEVKKLYDLNSKISEEANNLTKALKGDSKKQGNWGEVVLERILERSGLIKGEEYETQFTARNENGEMIRPDVVIKLPDNKHIIIDSKVSLVAYEQFSSAETIEDKDKFAKQHIDSIKNHVKGLSEKSYAHSESFNSPDFVLMFLPIESSFSIAIQQDIELFNFAWERRVVIVSPSTLLATLKTIESIWKREKQTQNANEIAKEAGSMYDKFANLIEDFKRMGNQLDTVRKTYDEASNKLYVGNGNIISKIEKLKKLGAKNKKDISAIAGKQMEFLPENEDTENEE